MVRAFGAYRTKATGLARGGAKRTNVAVPENDRAGGDELICLMS